MISFRCFIKNKFLILEDRFVDNYWFKISYEELLQILEESKLSLKKNLFLVTKNSEHSDIYKDDYEFPVTIYCEKEKIISFIKDNDYNSSLTKKSIFSEAKEEDDTEEDDSVLEDSEEAEPSLEDSEDLFSSGDSEKEDSTKEEKPEENADAEKEEETPKKDTDNTEEETSEPPDEISINENSIELDVNIILAIEVNLTGIAFFLDTEASKFIRLLNMKISTKNKPDDVIRKQISEVYKEKVIAFSEQNNITTNFIEE